MNHDDALEAALGATTPQDVDRLAREQPDEPPAPDDPADVLRWVARLEDGDPEGAAVVAGDAKPEPLDLEDLSPRDMRKWHEALGRGELTKFTREHHNKRS